MQECTHTHTFCWTPSVQYRRRKRERIDVWSKSQPHTCIQHLWNILNCSVFESSLKTKLYFLLHFLSLQPFFPFPRKENINATSVRERFACRFEFNASSPRTVCFLYHADNISRIVTASKVEWWETGVIYRRELVEDRSWGYMNHQV